MADQTLQNAEITADVVILSILHGKLLLCLNSKNYILHPGEIISHRLQI